MLCDHCKKNEATVHIREIHNGQCVTHHFCAECAAKQEQHGDLDVLGFNLAEVLFNVGKFTEELKKKQAAASGGIPADDLPELSCPVCHWTTAKIRESSGKLGCPECYHTFSKILPEALSRIQQGAVHLGKRPAGRSGEGPEALRFQLNRLQKELAALVAREEYEAAAVCRDRIAAVKNALLQVKK